MSRGQYHIETWGCQMNVHDSEKLAGALERAGYQAAVAADDADVILLNTCSIREKAAEKVFSELGRLRRFKERNPNVRIGVCGCVAQQEGERIFRRAPYVDFVLGPRAGGSLASTLSALDEGTLERKVDTEYRRDSIDFPFDQISRQNAVSGKAFVTVIEGCNHRCTYCIVPTTRGREICRPMEQILAEVRSLAARGVLEMEFLGQTVNAYRDAEGHTLGDLLQATADIEAIRRIRFTTSHPAQMTDALMDAMAAARPKVCPYLHLPVQSGSSAVLKLMRRGYDREGYLRKVDALRQRMPEMFFGTDIIVGFPGETEADFQETLSLIDEMDYASLYSFTYSPRPGTAALEHGDPVPPETKVERLQRLQERQKGIQGRLNALWVSREVEVLVEGPSKKGSSQWTGKSPESRVVNFSGDTGPGRLENLKVTGSTPFSLRGELVREACLTTGDAPMYIGNSRRRKSQQ